MCGLAGFLGGRFNQDNATHFLQKITFSDKPYLAFSTLLILYTPIYIYLLLMTNLNIFLFLLFGESLIGLFLEARYIHQMFRLI